MMGFLEYAARRQKAALPSPEKMLARLGIDPHGPHEIDVMRMVKAEKAAERATTKGASRRSPSGV